MLVNLLKRVAFAFVTCGALFVAPPVAWDVTPAVAAEQTPESNWKAFLILRDEDGNVIQVYCELKPCYGGAICCYLD